MKQDSPGVPFPPPLAFVVPFAVGYGLQRWKPRPLFPETAGPMLEIVGSLAVALGLVCIAAGMLTFGRAGTAIVPTRAASKLVKMNYTNRSKRWKTKLNRSSCSTRWNYVALSKRQSRLKN